MSATPLTYQLDKVKIPRWAIDMAMKDSRTNKLFAVYFALKAIFPNGEIEGLDGKAQELSTILCQCEKTFFKRIGELTDKGLLSHDKSTNKYSIISQKKFSEIYGFFDKERYHFVKLKAKLKFEYVIRATYLKIKDSEQFNTIIQRIKRSHQVDTRQAIKLAGELMSSQMQAFRDNTIRTYYHRADCSVNQATVATYFGRKSQASGHYWEHRLKELGLLKVIQREVFSPNYCRNEEMGYWRYAKGGKGTVLRLPNRLEFCF
jgi:hypothetical protein